MKYIRRTFCALWRAIAVLIGLGVGLILLGFYMKFFTWWLGDPYGPVIGMGILILAIFFCLYFFTDCKDKWGNR